MSDAPWLYHCNDCDFRWGDPASDCPSCGSRKIGRLSFKNFTASQGFRGALEGVADNARGDVQHVQYLSPSGMRADSSLGPKTPVDLTVRAPIDVGRRGEGIVADRVITQLRAESHIIVELEHNDSGGEDRQIKCDTDKITVQVVTVPGAPEFFRDASHGSASTSVTPAEAARWIYEAVLRKKDQYEPDLRAQMLLAVDVRAVGVLVCSSIIEKLTAQNGALCETTGFGGIWLVGPSDSRCIRLPGSRW
jgi:hypothetical protein